MSLARAIRDADPSVLPSRRDEDWRWSDLRGLLRQIPPPSPEGRAWAFEGPFAHLADMEVGVVNGRGATDLDLAEGQTRVVAWRFLSATDATAHAAELWVSLAPGAHLTLIESYEGAAGGYVCDTAVNIRLAEGAVMERIVVVADGANAVSVSHAEVALRPGARFSQTVLTTGARRQRVETRVRHPGGGAAVRLDGIYLVGAARHADITTAVDHEGLGGQTAQLTKGVVGGTGRGVFQGRILVAHGADQTDARMRHDALLLSDKAEVDAKPELLIYADDVSCSHGNTVGALDEEALFYIRARGVPMAEARALLTEAFVGEVIARIEHDGVRAAAAAWTERELQAVAS